MHSHKILNIALPDLAQQSKLSKELGISKILSQLLINRGIKSVREADAFLKADLSSLLDPFTFRQMPEAVKIIRKAARDKEKVMVFSDYDVDGVTALALLKNTLKKIGIEAIHYIPHRIKEGYGLNKNALSLAKEKKVKLMITADCGTGSQDHIEELLRSGTKVIVTDHHEAKGEKIDFPATATINPKFKDSGYQYRDLAGVGVAYKLCQALTGKTLAEELDLVSLGTIADAVPLTGENRIIAKQGLRRIFNTGRIGLKALMESSGISGKSMKPYFVSYILAPRINASGRMDTAETALSLLMSEEREKAEELARLIEGYNRQRQKVENRILEEAQDLIDRQVNFKEHKVLVVAKEGWHTGVLGVVASKLSDKFYRPTILISLNPGSCKGSGRSIKNFHLFQGMLECQDLLENFGGHKHAVGLVIDRGNIDNFRNRINSFAIMKLALEDLIPSFDIDLEVGLSDLKEELIRELEDLEPFGVGNPAPLFFTRNLRLKGQPLSLGRETLKFWVSDGRVVLTVIGFGMSGFKDSLQAAESFDLVYTPRIDNWKGENSLVLEAEEIFFR